jgi:predicted PurR-regulated permease PerM
MPKPSLLEISWGSIFKVFFSGLLFYFMFQTKDLIVWLIFAFVISLLFNPVINFLNSKLRIPRAIAVIVSYLFFFLAIGAVVYVSVPMFIKEIQQFFRLAPTYFERLSPIVRDLGIKSFEKLETYNESMQFVLNEASKNIAGALALIFGSLFKAMFTISAAFFLSLDEKKVRNGITLLFPKRKEKKVDSILKRVQKKVSSWFGGAIISASFVGLATFGTLLLFDVKYAGLFGLLAGLFGFIPFIGPTIVSVLAFAVVGIDSLPKAILVVSSFILIQQIEGNLITPAIAKRFVGIPPFLVITSVAIGGFLFGIPGAIMSIPLAGIIQEFLVEYLEIKRSEEPDIEDDE